MVGTVGSRTHVASLSAGGIQVGLLQSGHVPGGGVDRKAEQVREGSDVPGTRVASYTAATRHHPVRDERGGSQSVLVVLIVVSLLLVAGLIVDGGRKVAATQQAQGVAEGAARAGLNAAATDRIAGRPDTTSAVIAARRYIVGAPQVTGSVQLLAGGRLEVRTASTRPTVYLSAIGIGSVTGHGGTVAQLIASGGGR